MILGSLEGVAVVFIDLGLDRLNDNVDTINYGYYTRRLASAK